MSPPGDLADGRPGGRTGQQVSSAGRQSSESTTSDEGLGSILGEISRTPSSTRETAIARPDPRLAPVTMAVALSWRRDTIPTFLCRLLVD
jgi:hypothetical protein